MPCPIVRCHYFFGQKKPKAKTEKCGRMGMQVVLERTRKVAGWTFVETSLFFDVIYLRH